MLGNEALDPERFGHEWGLPDSLRIAVNPGEGGNLMATLLPSSLSVSSAQGLTLRKIPGLVPKVADPFALTGNTQSELRPGTRDPGQPQGTV